MTGRVCGLTLSPAISQWLLFIVNCRHLVSRVECTRQNVYLPKDNWYPILFFPVPFSSFRLFSLALAICAPGQQVPFILWDEGSKTLCAPKFHNLIYCKTNNPLSPYYFFLQRKILCFVVPIYPYPTRVEWARQSEGSRDLWPAYLPWLV